MTIKITFPTGQGTVRVECDGQVVEVPLPGGGGGGSSAADTDPPQSTGRSPRTVLPGEPRTPITRPPNEPPIAGIIASGRAGRAVPDALGMRGLLSTPRGLAQFLDMRQLYALPPDALRQQVTQWRRQRHPGAPFLIDLHFIPGDMPGEIPLQTLWPLLEDPDLDLSGVRLVIDPDAP